MTTKKSPLLDADHDPVRIADALRRSSHILGARAEPGSDRVIFTTLAGTGFDLTLPGAESTTNDILPVPDSTSPAPRRSSPREDTITGQTRNGVRYEAQGPSTREPLGLPMWRPWIIRARWPWSPQMRPAPSVRSRSRASCASKWVPAGVVMTHYADVPRTAHELGLGIEFPAGFREIDRDQRVVSL
ncbi:hypothetical protein [Streptomyces niveus]